MTNFTQSFGGLLDYIFYSEHFHLCSVLKLPSKKELTEQHPKGCPNEVYPSDHLMLYSKFSFKTEKTENGFINITSQLFKDSKASPSLNSSSRDSDKGSSINDLTQMLSLKEFQLVEKDRIIIEKDEQLKEKDQLLKQKDEQLRQKDQQIQELQNLLLNKKN